MGCAAGYSLQQDEDQSLLLQHDQVLLLESPVKNLYQPKTIEFTSNCQSLQWCDDDDDLEILFQECSRVEEDLVNANLRILKKDQKLLQQNQYQHSQSNTFSQTSICLNRKRNQFSNNCKFPDKNDQLPKSILKRKRLKESKIYSGKIRSKITQEKVVRFSKCYIRVIPNILTSKGTINVQQLVDQ
ncbi:unnamed protein product (macronuclear) [Paramecium tetraurelia]|uniref:Uncharacterized protein n=1 Tax=Paramecium tetraurelia TaxID=5888 RepID=A0D369_PARTE|nr:uncharacterized protein GSPATT00012971001 [Paramecium tetraurelia]CAK77486.1 unnamed protein product [Paramecium tetraurelia]|eukprot:XP_001444883.1 hypothetical protein (macronuclear) [Paramecium tetraurelia strain d4-2]